MGGLLILSVLPTAMAMAALCSGCGGGDRGAARPSAARPAPRPAGSSAADPAPVPFPAGAEAAAGEPTTAARAGADEAAAPPPADEPPDYSELKARIVQGDNSVRSLKALQKLGGKYQKNEEIPYLLGQMYFEKLWVGDGIKSFRRAIALQPLYRANSYVIKAAIAGLGNDRDHAQVRRFLVQDIGAPAAPFVEEVLYGEFRQQVKERATAILRELQ